MFTKSLTAFVEKFAKCASIGNELIDAGEEMTANKLSEIFDIRYKLGTLIDYVGDYLINHDLTVKDAYEIEVVLMSIPDAKAYRDDGAKYLPDNEFNALVMDFMKHVRSKFDVISAMGRDIIIDGDDEFPGGKQKTINLIVKNK